MKKGPLYVIRYSVHQWSSNRRQMEMRQLIHGKLYLFRGYDPQKDQIWLIQMDNKDSGEFCNTVSKLWLQINHRRWKRMLFIVDNASCLKSRYTADLFTHFPNCQVLFLLLYSPKLSPIEQRFRQYTKEVLEMCTFSSKEDLIAATNTWGLYYNTLRQEILSKGGKIQSIA